MTRTASSARGEPRETNDQLLLGPRRVVRPLAVAVRNSGGAPFILNLFHFEFVRSIFIIRLAAATSQGAGTTAPPHWFWNAVLGAAEHTLVGAVRDPRRRDSHLNFYLNDCSIFIFIFRLAAATSQSAGTTAPPHRLWNAVLGVAKSF